MCVSSWPFFMRSPLRRACGRRRRAPRSRRTGRSSRRPGQAGRRRPASRSCAAARTAVSRSPLTSWSTPASSSATAMSPAASPIRYARAARPARSRASSRVALALAAPAENDVQRRVVGRDGAPGRSGVRRLRVVHVAHAVRLGDRLQAMGDAREGLEALRRCARRRSRARAPRPSPPRRSRGCARPGCAARRAADRRLELDPRAHARNVVEAARNDRGVAFALVLEDPELRVAVGLERAVPVEVVGLEIEEHGDPRPKLVHVLELEAGDLADDDLVGLDLPVELGERAADVAGDRARRA